MKIMFNAEQWCKIVDITIYDPDGWDRKGDFEADWNKPITFDEFWTKCCQSTTIGGFGARKAAAEVAKNAGYEL